MDVKFGKNFINLLLMIFGVFVVLLLVGLSNNSGISLSGPSSSNQLAQTSGGSSGGGMGGWMNGPGEHCPKTKTGISVMGGSMEIPYAPYKPGGPPQDPAAEVGAALLKQTCDSFNNTEPRCGHCSPDPKTGKGACTPEKDYKFNGFAPPLKISCVSMKAPRGYMCVYPPGTAFCINFCKWDPNLATSTSDSGISTNPGGPSTPPGTGAPTTGGTTKPATPTTPGPGSTGAPTTGGVPHGPTTGSGPSTNPDPPPKPCESYNPIPNSGKTGDDDTKDRYCAQGSCKTGETCRLFDSKICACVKDK